MREPNWDAAPEWKMPTIATMSYVAFKPKFDTKKWWAVDCDGQLGGLRYRTFKEALASAHRQAEQSKKICYVLEAQVACAPSVEIKETMLEGDTPDFSFDTTGKK